TVPLLHVSMHGPTAPRASEVWTVLAERVRRVKRWQVPSWPDGPEPHTRFAAWLTALMRANGLGELLVALDGLDDLPADSDVPDLSGNGQPLFQLDEENRRGDISSWRKTRYASEGE